MPGKYAVEALFRLSAHVEPDGSILGVDESEILDFEDQSSFYGESITVEGGTLSFEVEADSEDEARDKAMSAVDSAYFDSNDIEWEISDMEISSIEEITPPMDKERATAILRDFVRQVANLTDEQRTAFEFLIELLLP